ncbi:MAG: hypothetical protein JWM88_2399 [Verrucomicrobia bacterium]|nr:hypothetical protein [Verrucomicrobiota bacterium]
MSSPSLFRYLVRESLLRWGGRAWVPLARLTVAASLATAALLVLASFALGLASLRKRIAEFGLDSIVIRTPLRRASDPAPGLPSLADYGRILTLTLPYAAAVLDDGRQVPIAIAGDEALRQLAALNLGAGELPVLITGAMPPGMPVRARVGPWSVAARTAGAPPELRPTGMEEMLITRAGDFPLHAMLPGTAVTLFVRAPSAPPVAELVKALSIVFANNPSAGATPPAVQSALPWLKEAEELQATWRKYGALLSAMLAVTIALVFGSAAILEYEAAAYLTALLRSFGVRPFWIWFQRAVEAAILANAGGAAAFFAAAALSRSALPQAGPFLREAAVFLPVFAALNAGALAASIPVAFALRRPVGLVLQ